MRVSLFHNPKAGDSTSVDHIRALIESAGHEVVRVFDREAVFGELVHDHIELVVAAGGDGTASAAARLMAGRSIPLAILPIGTANNIARTLYGDRPIEDLIAAWATARRQRVDTGLARGAWGERRFIEGVGVGAVPDVITNIQGHPLDAGDAASEIRGALHRYLELIARLLPRRWTIDVDGHELTQEWLFVEALNINRLGPNLELCTDADPTDGYFCVVTAGEEHRGALIEYLQERLAGRDGALSLPLSAARCVTIHGPDDVHVDDEVFAASSAGTTSIIVEPGAVEFLLG